MKEEKALVIGIELANEHRNDALESLKELKLLAYTAGAVIHHEVYQKIKKINPATFIGQGKVLEIQRIVEDNDFSLVLMDHDISPAQQNNLEEIIPAKVIDRTGLILDIFAQRAKSREGKLQVELAQLSYLLPRLTGHGVSMSRLAGGIGTRGPGETKLEYDRRKIRDRISVLKKDLELVKRTRDMHREKRQGVPIPIVTIMGYTNAGKSTLLNHLTNANVLAEDKLFATLDPTTRHLILPNHQKILLTDTVGFIRKLPIQLVEAFKATLEEVVEADLLLHLIDVSHPDFSRQSEEVLKILDQIGVEHKPIIHVYNKMDALKTEDHVFLERQRLHPFCMISAEKNQNLDLLIQKIQTALDGFIETIDLKIPISDQKTLSEIYSSGIVLETKYLSKSVRVKAQIAKNLAQKLKTMYVRS